MWVGVPETWQKDAQPGGGKARCEIISECAPLHILECEQHKTCEPPSDYDGRCGPASFMSLDQMDKQEQFAWKCRAGARHSCVNAYVPNRLLSIRMALSSVVQKRSLKVSRGVEFVRFAVYDCINSVSAGMAKHRKALRCTWILRWSMQPDHGLHPSYN